MLVSLAVALVALVLVLSVRDGHRLDGSVMWGDVAASGLTVVSPRSHTIANCWAAMIRQRPERRL